MWRGAKDSGLQAGDVKPLPDYFRPARVQLLIPSVLTDSWIMKTAYKFRIYVKKQQEARLNHTLEVCRHLWNDALADRNNTWKEEGITRAYNQQAALLRTEKGQNRYPGVHSQVLQDVLKRLNRAFVNFFGRVREGSEKKGYPRFKSRYKSITYPQSGFKLEGSRLTLSKIPGSIRIFMHREIWPAA